MSDFGVSIVIKKNDRTNISSEEIATITAILEELKNPNEYEDSLGENFQFSLIPTETGADILLSEYWIGDETEEEIVDFTDLDKDEAEKVIINLKEKLPAQYEFEIYHGSW